MKPPRCHAAPPRNFCATPPRRRDGFPHRRGDEERYPGHNAKKQRKQRTPRGVPRAVGVRYDFGLSAHGDALIYGNINPKTSTLSVRVLVAVAVANDIDTFVVPNVATPNTLLPDDSNLNRIVVPTP